MDLRRRRFGGKLAIKLLCSEIAYYMNYEGCTMTPSGVGRGGAQGARAPPSALGLVMPSSHSP